MLVGQRPGKGTPEVARHTMGGIVAQEEGALRL